MNKNERQSIYEIYRACRLCGESSGYKMPIIQSIIGSDGEEADLQRKIRECVQLEVTLTDRMPPLICEMCVEQINDFYQFRETCHNVNRNTRLRLGLPLQTRPQEKEYSSVGDTESVHINTDSEDGEPLFRQSLPKTRPMSKSAKARKEAEIQIKIQNYQHNLMLKESERSLSPEVNERRETRRNRGSSPKRPTKQNEPDDTPLSGLQGLQVLKTSTRSRAAPKSAPRGREKEKQVPERESSIDEENDDAQSLVRHKRLRERDSINYSEDAPFPCTKKPKSSSPDPSKSNRQLRPGPKSFKTGPSAEQNATPLPGPRSKKREPSPPPERPQPQPKAAPKSRKSEPSNEPVKTKKSGPLSVVKSKSELSPSPGPKSRKSVPLVTAEVKSKKSDFIVTGPKSRKCETVQKTKKSEPEVSVTKSKQHESSPAPLSTKSKSQKPANTPPVDLPQKIYQCNICGIVARAAQGLSSHMKVHVPSFTSTRLSCNACELWFANATEAATHHRLHTEGGKPYTCGKCYDDFELAKNYDLHFSRNQCLPTYEVPDVKCERCWHTYPTYKLLEEHRCQGEGGRPGGNCSKCKRSFATQKSLSTHEIRCTVAKKKVGTMKDAPVQPKDEPIVDPEVSRRLLTMQVRIAKCDAILKNLGRDNYDVQGISHRFGLDRNFSYPYLYSMGDFHVETDSFMDNLDNRSMNDETNNESRNDSFVHWDSDDSDTENCIDTSFETKTIDKLSTLTLKTLFSSKCLGKVPRKKRQFKTEKTFDSILSIDFPGDLKKNIDNIIDNLGNESQSDNYDSDSILDRKTDQSKSVKDFDNLKDNQVEIFESRNLENESHESDKSGLDDKAENLNDDENDAKMTENCSVDDNTDSQIDSIENDDKVTNENDANFDDTTQSNSVEESNSTNIAETDDNEQTVNDEDQLKNEVAEQMVFENESSRDEGKVEINTKTGEEKMDVDEQTELDSEINTNSNINDAIDEINRNENEELANNNESSNHMNTDDSQKSSDTAIDDTNDGNNDSTTDASTYKRNNDSNDEEDPSTSSNTINHNDMNDSKDDTQLSNTMSEEMGDVYYKMSDADLDEALDRKMMNDPNYSYYDTDYIKILENSVKQENDLKNASVDRTTDQNKQTGLNFNSLTDDDNISSKVQITDKFNIDDLNDEEKQLMAELDEQIGESSDVIGRNNSESDPIGKNKAGDDMYSENRADNVNCESRADDEVTEENKTDNVNSGNGADNVNSEREANGEAITETMADNIVIGQKRAIDVISENKADKFNKNDSNIIMPNVGFSDMEVDDNNDSFNSLMKKHDDLTSLDLDSISEEEFDFDA